MLALYEAPASSFLHRAAERVACAAAKSGREQFFQTCVSPNDCKSRLANNLRVSGLHRPVNRVLNSVLHPIVNSVFVSGHGERRGIPDSLAGYPTRDEDMSSG